MNNFIASLVHLTKLEWLKYKNYTFAKVVLGGFTAMFCLVLLYAKEIVPQASPPLPSVATFFEFPTVWDYQGQIGNWLVCILLGFLVINLITMEVSAKTMRQNIINGLTRAEFFMAKFILILSLATFATLIYIVSTLIYGLLHTSDPDLGLVFDTNYAIIRFWIMSMGYLSFALLISFLIRRSGFATIIYFGWVFVVEFLLRMLQLYYFKSRAILFWPINSIEDVMPNPLYSLPDMWMEKSWGFKPLLTHVEASLMAVFYTGLLISLAWFTYRNKSL